MIKLKAKDVRKSDVTTQKAQRFYSGESLEQGEVAMKAKAWDNPNTSLKTKQDPPNAAIKTETAENLVDDDDMLTLIH